MVDTRGCDVKWTPLKLQIVLYRNHVSIRVTNLKLFVVDLYCH